MLITELLIYALWLVLCVAFGYYHADAVDWFLSIVRRFFSGR